MLPEFIIEEIKRRERLQKQDRPQPRLELPLEQRPRRDSAPPPSTPRVVIIPLWDQAS